MYNDKIKTQFIEETITLPSKVKLAISIFNALEPFEEQWGADVCTQPLDVVTTTINGILGLRASSGLARITVVKEYVQWCADHGIPNVCTDLLKLHRSGVEGVYEYTLKNPDDLQDFLDRICDAEKFQTYDCAIRVWAWLAFMGFSEEESVEITTSDVDLKSMLVKHRMADSKFSRSGDIYPQSLNAFRQCLKQTFYHPVKDGVVERDRAPGNELVRGTRAKGAPRATTLRVALLKRNNAAIDSNSTTKRLSYMRIWLSGVFYRQYINEKITGSVSFISVASEQAAKAPRSKVDAKAYEYKRNQLAKNFEIDYQRWKIVYGLNEE